MLGSPNSLSLQQTEPCLTSQSPGEAAPKHPALAQETRAVGETTSSRKSTRVPLKTFVFNCYNTFCEGNRTHEDSKHWTTKTATITSMLARDRVCVFWGKMLFINMRRRIFLVRNTNEETGISLFNILHE